MNPINKKDFSNLEYIELLLEHAIDAEQRNTEEALKLSNEALELSKKYHFKKHEARSYVRIGRCHWINGNYNDALDFLTKALEITDNINDAHTKADALIGLGNVYITIELFDKAISHYDNALNISQNLGYGELEAKILNNMGTLHEDLKNYPVALDYYQKSLEKTVQIEDYYGEAIANLNIGNVFLSLEQPDQAEKYITKAIGYGKEHKKTLLLAHSYYSLGKLNQMNQHFEDSKKNLKQSIDLAEASKDLYILFRIYMELATTKQLMGECLNAEAYLIKAQKVAKQINMSELYAKIHEQMALFYDRSNQQQESYEHYKAYFKASKAVEENRRLERIKSIDFQSKLSASMEETKVYRQLSNELRKSYQQMHVLSDIGQAMTSTHKLSDIFEQLYQNVNLLMNAESLGVGLYDEKENGLRFDLFIEKGKYLDSFTLSLENKKSWSVWCYLNKQTVKINDIEKEYLKYIEGLASTRGDLNYSAMYAPLMVEGEVIGVFSIQTRERNAYSENDKDLLQTLASYLAIAIKNATKTIQLAELNQTLKNLSEQDGLTGIPNRRLYDETYQAMYHKALNNNEELSVMMIDVDNFKNFNDQFGHLVGDEVIKKVARYLYDNRQNSNDFVARYGGDEFVVLLPRVSKQQVDLYAYQLVENINQLNSTLEPQDRITFSIGTATLDPKNPVTQDQLISEADEMLYKDKAQNKQNLLHQV
jgi:diguanylate cyclase (GGDEF)-like protein